MVRILTHPTHPGIILLEEFLTPMKLTQRDLAKAIHVSYQHVNELVNQKRGITPSTALRLAKFFDMCPEFWLNLQLHWDLYHAQQKEVKQLERIRPYTRCLIFQTSKACHLTRLQLKSTQSLIW